MRPCFLQIKLHVLPHQRHSVPLFTEIHTRKDSMFAHRNLQSETLRLCVYKTFAMLASKLWI